MMAVEDRGWMDSFNRWLSGWMDTPGGSLAVPMAIIIGRCLASAVAAHLDRRKRRKKKRAHA